MDRMQSRKETAFASSSMSRSGAGQAIVCSAGYIVCRNDFPGESGFALETPFVDVGPGAVFGAFLVEKGKPVGAVAGPSHAPLGVDADHGHQAEECDGIAIPAFR